MSQDAQRAPAVQPDSAGHQALRRADPGPATAALGNQATADLAGLDLMHVAAALPAVGNLALGRLLGGGPARPDPLADPDFNPEAVVDRLARAIDSDDVKLVSLPHLDLATGTYVEGVFLRHVDAAAVAAALENLTAAQAEYVSALYAGTEKRPLAQDLFAQGNSGYPSDLPKDRRRPDRCTAARHPPRAGRTGRWPGRPAGPDRRRRRRGAPAPGPRAGRAGPGTDHGPASPRGARDRAAGRCVHPPVRSRARCRAG
jgi:hypothetical protein